MSIAIVLLTRDLRLHDHPALSAACAAFDTVVPLFVTDPTIPSSPNRDRFLVQSLTDLRGQLRQRGGDLVIRSGDPVTETMRLAHAVEATGIALSADVSAYAAARSRRLAAAARPSRISVREFPGVTLVPPGRVTPAGGDHYKVFTPYYRAWSATRWRSVVPAPPWVPLPQGFSTGRMTGVRASGASPDMAPGGETEGRRVLARWRQRSGGYADGHDDLAGDRTSRLSPYLHFGCVSAREVAAAVNGSPAFLRQLCWRDFYAQVLAAFPELPSRAYRGGADDWRQDKEALAAWRDGQTGVPVVDAGMRQLAREGWMHNRARLITAAFLTRYLGLDWREGMRVYAELLLDADVANNAGNWQWVAGTGHDTRPHRQFNPVRQARRFDPDGGYVRRYVPELAGVADPDVHEPWKLSRPVRGYPEPLPGTGRATWLDR